MTYRHTGINVKFAETGSLVATVGGGQRPDMSMIVCFCRPTTQFLVRKTFDSDKMKLLQLSRTFYLYLLWMLESYFVTSNGEYGFFLPTPEN